MQSPDPHETQPYNLANELAKERTRAAADRTLMAWIRTALSLIGFGFGIPTIIRTIEASRMRTFVNPHYFSTVVGLSFIGVGIFAMAMALQEHRHIQKRIQRGHFTYENSWIAEAVGFALLLIGVFSFIGVLLRSVGS